MDDAALRADCARCAGLCCVAPAFDRSPEFAIDKPAGTPCPNLDAGNRCRIYPDRERLGFAGCVGFDCHGAGQRITQDVFAGRSWREHPELLPAMATAYATMRQVQELALLLAEASRLPLSKAEQGGLQRLKADLDPPQGWSRESIAVLDIGATTTRVRAFLASLRHHFQQK